MEERVARVQGRRERTRYVGRFEVKNLESSWDFNSYFNTFLLNVFTADVQSYFFPPFSFLDRHTHIFACTVSITVLGRNKEIASSMRWLPLGLFFSQWGLFATASRQFFGIISWQTSVIASFHNASTIYSELNVFWYELASARREIIYSTRRPCNLTFPLA